MQDLILNLKSAKTDDENWPAPKPIVADKKSEKPKEPKAKPDSSHEKSEPSAPSTDNEKKNEPEKKVERKKGKGTRMEIRTRTKQERYLFCLLKKLTI